MSNEVAKPTDPMAAFQERVKSKVRDDIAAMLPDEAIDAMVKRVVEEQFFQPRKVFVPQSWGSPREEIHPSWFVEEVTKAAKPMLDKMIADWVEMNRATLKDGLHKFLEEQNLMLLAVSAMRSAMTQDFFAAAQAIVEEIRRPR